MSMFLEGMRRFGRILFDSRSIVSLGGLVASVAFHELFHILVHWGHIITIQIFPNATTIMQVVSATPPRYNPEYEEAIAYTITLLTLLLTAVIIGYLHDQKDTRTFRQTVFPRDASMQKLTSAELFELARRTNTF